MASNHKNAEKLPYLFFRDDYFEYSNIKIGPQTPEIAFLASLRPLKICARLRPFNDLQLPKQRKVTLSIFSRQLF